MGLHISYYKYSVIIVLSVLFYQLTPIQRALEYDHLDVCKFLLNKGAKAISEDWVSSIECI